MTSNEYNPQDFDFYSVTLDSRQFGTDERYSTSKAKFLNLSPKLKATTRMIGGKELCTVTLDPSSVDTKAEYDLLEGEMRKLAAVTSKE